VQTTDLLYHAKSGTDQVGGRYRSPQ